MHVLKVVSFYESFFVSMGNHRKVLYNLKENLFLLKSGLAAFEGVTKLKYQAFCMILDFISLAKLSRNLSAQASLAHQN